MLLAAPLCAGLLLTGGCGSDPPRADPSPTPTAIPSPTPTPPALPARARKHTKAGALAFAKHYIELINYAQATGDVSALKRVEARGCKSCANVRKHLRRTYEHGGSIHGGKLTVTAADALPNPESHGYNVDLAVRASAEVVRSGSGRVDRAEGGKNILTFFLAPRKTTWIVLAWTRAK